MSVHILEHPLLKHKLSIMRDKNTGTKQFRELAEEMAMLMVYDVTRDLKTKEVEIETPLETSTFPQIDGKMLGVVPVLRAGVGMLNGVLNLIPGAKVGFIGMYRDEETLEPVEYYCKLPEDADKRMMIVIDPMLATGGSARDAITMLKERGCKNIKLVNILAAPEGIETVSKAHPDVDIYVAAVDVGLNENGYIVPGLGDAGDRLFGTK